MREVVCTCCDAFVLLGVDAIGSTNHPNQIRSPHYLLPW